MPSTHTQTHKFIVAQLGARRDYAIPKMLHEAGMLEHCYTDICAVKGWPRLLNITPDAVRPAGLKRLLGRVPRGVPTNKITAFTRFGWEYQQRSASSTTSTETTTTHLWAGKRFCELILGEGLKGVDGVYTFNSAGLELLTAAKKGGLRTVMEQTIAPKEIEMKLLEKEHQRHPGWEPHAAANLATNDFISRERAEWAQADLILCGSEFVRESIAACDGPVERCAVVPYGVDVRFSIPERPPHNGPLRVLTIGAVGLRKGSPYVLEAAKRLRGKAEFRMVGSVDVLLEAETKLRSAIDLIGSIPRAEILEQYIWADVFLLPSLCEGSATVVYEALSAGLPVICTHNTGSVVRDGVEGYIVPHQNFEEIVKRVEQLANDSELLQHMAASARERAEAFLLSIYRRNLLKTLSTL